MFKRAFNIITIILSAIIFSSCCSSKDSIKENIVTGVVYVVGNEPFTKVGIQTDEKTIYILDCSKEIEDLMRKHQGEYFNVVYNALNDTPEGKVIKVVKSEKK